MSVQRFTIASLVIFMFSSILLDAQGNTECDKINAKIEVKSLPSGIANVTVVLSSELTNVKFIFCNDKGDVLNEGNFNKNELKGLKRGDYLCIINTPNCSKKIDFKID